MSGRPSSVSLREMAVQAQYCRPMPELPRNKLKVVLRDVHFWIPIAVLIGGLFVLRWMQ
jgi:hypothetical protein